MHLPKPIRLVVALSAMGIVPFSEGAQLKFISSWKDVSIYTKTKSDLFRQWDQEFGVQATYVRSGNFSSIINVAYDPIYPIRFNIEPRWNSGIAFNYYFVPKPIRLGIYTKTKYNLINTWKQESGLSVRFYTSPALNVSTNVGYQWTYPYIEGKKPGYQAQILLAFPLGR